VLPGLRAPGGSEVLVEEWMTENPTSVADDTPVMEAMQLLRRGGYRRLPVLASGRLVGIVTDRDLKEATPSKASTLSVYEMNYLLSKLLVRDVMSPELITVASHDPIENAALLMEEYTISGLPVVNDGELVGIFTITDLLRAFITFLGLREGGIRVTADLPDAPGVLAQVAQAAPPSNISAVATAASGDTGQRRLVLRVIGEGASGFTGRLRAAGVHVVDER
jgi:acetoin utilization protein AcuB